MLDSELHQYLAYTQFLLKAVDLPHLLETLKESSAGYPTGHEGRTELDENGEAVTYDSRTESAALHPDPAREARKAVEKSLRALRNEAVNLHGTYEAWLRTADANKAKGQGEPGCKSCARLKVTIKGRQEDRWEPRRKLSEKVVPRDENGHITYETVVNYSAYCEWCDDWVNAEGEPPPMRVLQARYDGKRITSALLAKLGVKTRSDSARDRRKKAS